MATIDTISIFLTHNIGDIDIDIILLQRSLAYFIIVSD